MKKTKVLRCMTLLMSVVLTVGLILPKSQMQAQAANPVTLTFTEDQQALYEKVKSSMTSQYNSNANASYDDTARTVTVNDPDEVKYLSFQFLSTVDYDKLYAVLDTFPNLEILYLQGVDLSGNNLKSDKINAQSNLTLLCLTDCNLSEVPDLNLNNLETLYLSENDFSAQGALSNIDGSSLPAIKTLYIDRCKAGDISFLSSLTSGQLEQLSLGYNKLNDEDIKTISDLGNSVLANLSYLNLGEAVHTYAGSVNRYDSNGNEISQFKSLFQLPKLAELDLSLLSITSLEDFKDCGATHPNIRINFSKNAIVDFCGLESNANFSFRNQKGTFNGNYAAGRSAEIPALLAKILDANDSLAGTVSYTGCSLSADKTKIEMEAGISKNPYIEVSSGELNGSKFTFQLKSVPTYTIPQGLTANVGDTLADVAFTDSHFTWMDDSQDVGKAGVHTFMAKYTPDDETKYIVEENIPVAVTVKEAGATTPNPQPEQQNPQPEQQQNSQPEQQQNSQPEQQSNQQPVLQTQEGTEQSSQGQNAAQSAVSAPKTSDSSLIFQITIILLVSGILLSVIMFRKKKYL